MEGIFNDFSQKNLIIWYENNFFMNPKTCSTEMALFTGYHYNRGGLDMGAGGTLKNALMSFLVKQQHHG